MISFELSEEQKNIQEEIRDLAEMLRPLSLKIEAARPGPINKTYRNALIGNNLNSYAVPSEYGGRFQDWLTISFIMEEIGYGCAGFATIYAAVIHAISAILIGGSTEQKEKFLPLFLKPAGAIVGCCITEEKGGSDVSSFDTFFRQKGDGYVINGTKNPVVNAGDAAFYIVWANRDKDRGRSGIEAFIIPKGVDGITISAYQDKAGLRCAPTAAVSFHNVVVPKSNLVGFQGSGYLLLMQNLDWTRALYGAISVGVARAAIEEAINFAKEHVLRTRPIIKNQGISFTLADMAMEIDAARLLVWRACRLMDLNMDYTREASMAKVFASEVASRATSEGMLILAKHGFLQPHLMAKYQRDAQGLRFISGTDQINKIIISSQL